MRLSTILLFVSWIPLIQMLLLRFNSNRAEDINVYIFLPLSILLSIIGTWLLVKEFRKKVELYRLIIRFLSVVTFTALFWGIPAFFSKVFFVTKLFGNSREIIFLGYSLLLLIIVLSVIQFRKKFLVGKKINRVVNSYVITPIIVLIYFGVPAVFIHIYHIHEAQDKLWIFWAVLVFLTITTALSIWLYREYRKKVKLYESMIHFTLLLLFPIILLGIPVFTGIAKLFRIDPDIFYKPLPSAGLIICIISAALSCSALVLVWREAQKEEKPYIPVLKFILASVFVIWQLNLGFHFYIEMHTCILGIGYYIHWTGGLWWLTTPRQILSIGYITVNVLFFSDILLRGKIKNGQDLSLLPGAGLLILSGTYMLMPLMVTAVKLLPAKVNTSLFVVTLSFVTIIGPVLIIAVILSGFGGILALFKGMRHFRFPASVRKGVIVSSITIILYVLLFKSLWPIRDPSMNVLIRMMKENKKMNWDGISRSHSHYGIAYGCFCEILSFRKGAVGLLIEKLNDDDAYIRKNSALILMYNGGKRVVNPLIVALNDKDGEVRATAARSLGGLRDRRAIVPLIDLLKEKDLRVVEGAVDALSCFKEVRVVEALIEKLRGNVTDRMKNITNEALWKITWDRYEGQPENMWEWWQEWWRKNKEKFIIKVKRRLKKRRLK